MDENRAVDGIDLRREFSENLGRISFGPQDDLPCSILEMLIGLAKRCNDWVVCDIDDHYGDWFWIYISNLGLMMYDDLHYNSTKVDRILEKWLRREIGFDGSGGIFPLKNPETNQQRVEIWSQMNNYLNENFF